DGIRDKLVTGVQTCALPILTLLFDDTVRNNIAYGKDEISDEAIIEAARAAYAHEFIMKLPDGYDTLIGENGVKLSGGERQRLARSEERRVGKEWRGREAGHV